MRFGMMRMHEQGVNSDRSRLGHGLLNGMETDPMRSEASFLMSMQAAAV